MVTTFHLKIEVNGETPFPSVSGFSLVQSYDGHHKFELRLPLQYVEGPGTENLEKSKAYLGESVKMELSESNADGGAGTKLNEFNGVITGISIARYGGVASDLLVTGFSPTILLDHGLNTKVFSQTNLSGLVSSITSKYPLNGVVFKINPNPDPQFAFVHQHKESTYNFLRRLANRYGQWFFYDGKDCIFGKLPGGNATPVKFGFDLTAFELGLSMAPTKFKTMALDANGKSLQAPSMPVAHLDQSGAFAFDQSNKYFFEEQLYNTDQNVTSASDVQDIARIRRAAIAAGLVKLMGESVNAKLKIGSGISVSAENIKNNSSTDYGSYTIVAMRHNMDGRGNYCNSFAAIPSAVDIPPPMKIEDNSLFDFSAWSVPDRQDNS